MKIISAELTAHLAGEVTTLAMCWKLTRTDSVVMGFTDHDKDLEIDGVDYSASSGFTPTAVANTSNLSVDNLDVDGMLDADVISEEDVMAGIYDFAEIEVFQVNYSDLTQGILQLRRGWLGEVTLKNHQFVAEIRGLTQRLSQNIGELYSPSCRARLGDSRCKVNMATHTHTGTITSVESNSVLYDTARTEDNGIFTFGKITFTSGGNNGLSMEVKEYTVGKLVLALPMPYTAMAGDSYSIEEGCDKTLATCKNTFNNVVNFRGEPHVPGLDRIFETAGTRSEW